jgi:membrane associated rhomboid family serine protease
MLIFLGIFVTTVRVPAVYMLGYWFLLQLVGAIPALAQESGGIAFWAHAGGFIAGAVLISLFKSPELLERRARAFSLG